ncbi:uncharacterized protein LOC131232295 [Magnolia sinica]|uniref:uncharacterized protein LOC131232295 n=1 Tax=Magnolia sinica TaxID=86752 RepID=UPI002658623B|nr:uncharacterized protein LOC131232295 [Magnolia sinica]
MENTYSRNQKDRDRNIEKKKKKKKKQEWKAERQREKMKNKKKKQEWKAHEDISIKFPPRVPSPIAYLPSTILDLFNLGYQQQRFESPLFLRNLLHRFGFSGPWVKLVERCWANCWFSVLVNGDSAGFFKSTRGLGKGDLLSPNLFILAAEALSRGISNLMARGDYTPYQLGRRCPQVSHLLYADDTLLFLNEGLKSIRAMKSFLTSYQRASGQEVNVVKSSFLCSGRLSAPGPSSIQRALGISRTSSDLLYLGVLVGAGRRKAVDFQHLLDKVDCRIRGWQSRCLTQAGRAVLQQNVLTSIPVHTLAAVQVPCGVLKDLERRFSDFFWGWNEGKKKLHWRSWSHITTPKSEGGLSIRNLTEVMVALGLKLV